MSQRAESWHGARNADSQLKLKRPVAGSSSTGSFDLSTAKSWRSINDRNQKMSVFGFVRAQMCAFLGAFQGLVGGLMGEFSLNRAPPNTQFWKVVGLGGANSPPPASSSQFEILSVTSDIVGTAYAWNMAPFALTLWDIKKKYLSFIFA